jgi:SAM-dependent methyltransferase
MARAVTERGRLFDGVAEAYDRFRPSYPAPLIDEACSIGGLEAGSRVLDLGCGTGKLTVALAERGLDVEALDPGPRMVEIARRHVPTARFHIAGFEEADLPSGAFDAVFSAMAFHWVAPDVGWSKAARVLRPGGLLALIWYINGSTELDAALLAVWRAVLPEAADWPSRDDPAMWEAAQGRRGNVSELWSWLANRDLARPEAAGLFTDVRLSKLPVEIAESTNEVIGHVRTTTAYMRLDAERQGILERRLADVVEARGGTYHSTHFATLVTARVAGPRT